MAWIITSINGWDFVLFCFCLFFALKNKLTDPDPKVQNISAVWTSCGAFPVLEGA